MENSYFLHGRRLFMGLAVISLACHLAAIPASGQEHAVDPGKQSTAWAASAIAHARLMRVFRDVEGTQQTPSLIPRFDLDLDPNGLVATYQPGGPTITANNPFFQNLGTNGRTCFTCHQPQTGWTISAHSAQASLCSKRRQGARCSVSSTAPPAQRRYLNSAARRQAYHPVLEKGLIRIGLPLPPAVAIAVRGKRSQRPLQLHTNPSHRSHQPDDRHRLDLPPSPALNQSELPQHHHVGRT